ncbi:NAD(P)-binding domain-containing protein [Amycolatopsis rubida]|uniref:NAD(P)-binding domain-containing protein n=1 Tax=Amycolatopsis rubida TaxID=112413 RepID=A0ABX0BHL0_9PSEU|nr:NAD(P)-binding domain-containing protein [Amycolatopsis sp. M39]MYW89854.1 NAD(P)-binding domain-containing protein [Amycolatopsis rubida]NEC54831.1 NAD(P)-binding domain-containing protein [Amycolatopsis rubida]OAP26808.1 Pyrroline-5-carboxylate reductase [Amycolatopsis sp. M39]
MLGFVGAGELTAAIVTGLDGSLPVVLSPRSREISAGLAARYPDVRVCSSNQEVLDQAGTVVLAVRPPVLREVVDELTFRPEHVVLSAVAGVRVDQLREWVAPASRVVRSIPLPQAARRQSLTAMYPEDAVARELFERVGRVVVPRDEPSLEAFSAATSTFAAHLDYLATIVGWMVAQGVEAEVASAYVTHVFAQVGKSLAEGGPLAELTSRHLTPGGINEQLLTHLRAEGMPETVRQGLDAVLARLRGAVAGSGD